MTATKELVAGRELDALVAEKVMGWNRCAPAKLYDVAHGYRPNKNRSDDQREFVPRYSRDIAAAWEVVEKLQPNLYLELTVERVDVELWVTAKFIGDRWKDPNQYFVVENEHSVPEAICRAALKAVGYA